MKFCPVVPEICHGHVHVAKKERRRIIMIIIIIIIIIRNGAKTISLQTTFGRLNNLLLIMHKVSHHSSKRLPFYRHIFLPKI
jgi:hypothetical protein